MSLTTSTGSRERIETELTRDLFRFARSDRLWIGGLLCVLSWGIYAYVYQLYHGLQVTAMRDYVSWGLYMANFVFFIGISHAGTLISAILRVTGAEWRRPITRMAEAITVMVLLVGASMVIIDMGRPDRVLNVIVHGRIQSPILWDVFSISTYLIGSCLYLYVAMVPDLALLRDRYVDGFWNRVYRLLAIGYRDTQNQRRILDRALAAMAVIIIPVAVSVHTVVSWIFGMTLRPGWHSTIFGPYFVVGAIYSGTAAIITAMFFFRWAYGLQGYLTLRHFRALGSLLLALGLIYAYFTLSEYLTIWYGAETADARLIENLMTPSGHGVSFWLMVVLGLFIPTLLLFFFRSSIKVTVFAAILVNVGMFVKRYLIVVGTLQAPYIPVEAGGGTASYFPTWVEWSITAAGMAAFLLLYTMFSKVFPIISIWEVVEGKEKLGEEAVGLKLGTKEARS